jgi:hypothetical protein
VALLKEQASLVVKEIAAKYVTEGCDEWGRRIGFTTVHPATSEFPKGLKPDSVDTPCGTAEAVPFQNKGWDDTGCAQDML